MNVLKRLQQVLVAITAQANQQEQTADTRKLTAIVTKASRKEGGLLSMAKNLETMQELKENETSLWVEPKDIKKGGVFDACNLEHWIALAQGAGVSTVPAQRILTLTEEEISAFSGYIELPKGRALDKIQQSVVNLVNELEHIPQIQETDPDLAEKVQEKCFEAMDNVPEGWMVRHQRCGPSVLKSLAGAGTINGHVPEVDFGPDLVVGPGWVRNGNRRRVDICDQRTMKIGIGQGPDHDHSWLARPWIKAARWTQGSDPHRAGTPLEGNGFWPAEWRAFIENGLVTGVSYYYPWAGMAQPEDARIALKVREQAQKIIDYAKSINAIPGFMDLEFARNNPQFKEMGFDKRFPKGSFAGCIDFIEVQEEEEINLFLLEGGPPMTPFGGAHPCGFISQVKDTHRCEGVALKLPHGVHMMEPSTWNVNHSNAIFSWEEIKDMAELLETRTNLSI